MSHKVNTYRATADARHTSSVLEFRWCQDTTTHFHHIIGNCQAELLHVRVVVEVSATNEIVDLAFSVKIRILETRHCKKNVKNSPVRSRSRSGLNHRRRLHVCQFFDATLPCHDITHLKRQISMFVLLSDLQTR